MKKAIDGKFSTVVLLIISLVPLIALGFRAVAAQDTNIYIKSDGSVAYGYVDGKPPIKRDGDLYTLTGDVGRIVIQRSNIVLDGDGYRIEVGTHGGLVGISVSRVVNVTIMNTRFVLCETGVYSSDSSFINIMNNKFYSNVFATSFNGSVQSTLIQKNIFTDNQFCVRLVSDCHNTVISENDFSNNRIGIYIENNCDNSQIVRNNLTSTTEKWKSRGETGIWISGLSLNCKIVQNRISKQMSGVTLSSGGNDLYGNIFENCGLRVYDFLANNISANTVNGKPLVYMESFSDRVIEEAGQVILVNCSNVTVKNLNLSYASVGITLWKTSNSRIEHNRILGHQYTGIYASFSDNNTIVGNHVEENGNGIQTYGSKNNMIYHNNFIDNSGQADTDGNVLDGGYPSGGNYWSDYTGIDLKRGSQQDETGSDGIGDTPYYSDNYPLMNPWHEPPWIPYASFGFSPAQPIVNETIVFDARNSYDFDGQIVNYLWNFGDGIVVNETNPMTNHPYTFPKSYNVSLIVVDNEGLSNTTERTINVIKISANLSITANPSTFTLRQNTTLNGSISPARAQINVTIWSKSVILANVTTDEYGNYSFNWNPSAIGAYTIKANWTGDEYTFPSETTPLVVTCTRIPTSLSILTTSSPALKDRKSVV